MTPAQQPNTARDTQLVHTWVTEGGSYTFSWIGRRAVAYARVYALAFVPDGRMLLVGGPANEAPPGNSGGDSLPGSHDGRTVTAPDPDEEHWLPGGGVESGESHEEALRRELMEEAAARPLALRLLGGQLVEDDRGRREHHGFYWCPVTLAAHFTPAHEVTQRVLVPVDAFLDTLFWGRADPKGPLLLSRALDFQRDWTKGSRA